MAQTVLNVPDISCEHCERAITQALRPLTGVSAVRVDIPAKQVHLDYDPAHLDLTQVGEILDEEGYPVAPTAQG